MSEKITVSLCKRSKPGDESRFTVKHTPIPGGVRQGPYERVFVSALGVRNILRTLKPAVLEIAPQAKREL